MEFIPEALLSDVVKLAHGKKSIAPSKKSGFTRPKDAKPLKNVFSSTSLTDVRYIKKGHVTFDVEEKKPANVPIQPKTLTIKPENAFHHETTAMRVTHLVDADANPGEKLTFIYESPDPLPAVEDQMHAETNSVPTNPKDILSDEPVPLDTAHLNVAVGMTQVDTFDPSIPGVLYPSLKPTSRKEVAILQQTMMKLLDAIGADIPQPYPSEMHAFLAVIDEEQKIYDTVFQEIIRQVTVNMSERGELLSELRKRYASMFVKIPRHIKHLHTELIAQRRLNRRLSEEVIRAKETVASLMKELEFVKKHDDEITKQAQDAQEKLVSMLTQTDNTDEILEEYHKLYRMQRDRLEDAVRLSEQEKRIWIDASTSLAIRVGEQNGVSEVLDLQKQENQRLRTTKAIIVNINDINDTEIGLVEKKITEWRTKLLYLSQSVVQEDQLNVEILASIQREMKTLQKNLIANEPQDMVETQHPMLKVFHVYEARTILEHMNTWVDQITVISGRFTSDKDISLHEEIEIIRKMAETWIETGFLILKRNQKSTNGKEYIGLGETLESISKEIDEWLVKIERRVSGEDGIASQIIGLQNQLEDRLTAYSSRDMEKPLPTTDRNQLRDCLINWIDIAIGLSSTLSNTIEKEQYKIPLHVENWLSKLADQINTDTDIRNEENHKLHTSITSWVVHLLVKGGREAPSDSWDNEFYILSHEIAAFNQNLIRDAADLDMMNEAKIDLRKVLQSICDQWIALAKKLLIHEKRNAEKIKAGQAKTTLTLSQENLLKEIGQQ